MIATKIVGAIVGIGLAFGIVIAPGLAPPEPIVVTCTDVMLIPRPETDATEIFLTCHAAGDAAVELIVPPVGGQ